uniref:Uncharacterized protein n=1 Tax=Lepeophtheirus salmonis TaxID=72036 RepID=A0A0K2T254_LEPSM
MRSNSYVKKSTYIHSKINKTKNMNRRNKSYIITFFPYMRCCWSCIFIHSLKVEVYHQIGKVHTYSFCVSYCLYEVE